METFKINGLDVPKETYQSFQQLLYVVGNPPKNIFSDKHVSAQEIRNFLDASGKPDKFLRVEDLTAVQSKVGTQSFDTLVSFLEKYNFNPFAECFDFPSSIYQYDPQKPAPFWGNRDFVGEAIRTNPAILQFAGPNWQANREMALMAVRIDGRVLKYLPQFKKDAEVVRTAVKSHGEALLYADPIFWSNKEIVLEAVHTAGWIFCIVDEKLRADEEVASAAVQSHEYALECVAPKLREKEPFASIAKRPGRFASKNFKVTQDRNIKDLNWLSGIFEKDSLPQIYKETEGGHALTNKRALQIFLFMAKVSEYIQEKPIEIHLLRRFGPDLLNFYFFAKRLVQQPAVVEKVHKMTFHNGPTATLLLAALKEPVTKSSNGEFRFCSEPFHVVAWAERAMDLSYKLFPAGSEPLVTKKGKAKIPAGTVGEIEIFSSQWLKDNSQLPLDYTPYQLSFMSENKEWAPVGKPIEIRRGCGGNIVRPVVPKSTGPKPEPPPVLPPAR